MALDLTYYRTWSAKSKDYKLTFVVADPTDLGASPTNSEIPGSIYINKCIVESGYDDDIFLGLPLADTMDLEINISRGQAAGGTTASFIQYLEKVVAPTTRTVNGEAVTIPNIFILEAKDTGDVTYDELLFVGSQDNKPGIEYEVTNENVIAKLKIVSLVRAAMERVTMNQIKPSTASLNTYGYVAQTQDRQTVSENDRIYDYYYSGLSIYSDIKSYEIVYFDLINNLMLNIQSKVSTMVSALSRGLYTFALPSELTLSWTFNEVNTSDEDNNRGTALDEATDIYYIPYVEDKTAATLTIVAGLFSENGKNATFYSYKNVWDLLKILFENYGAKWYFSFNASVITLTSTYLLNKTDTGGTTTLTGAMLENDFELLTKGDNIVNEVIVTYKDTKSEDIEDVTFGSLWTQSEDSLETELILHNAFISYDADDTVYNRVRDGNTFTGQYQKSNIAWRNLFTNTILGGKSNWFKVCDECVYSTGDVMTPFGTISGSRFDPLYTDEGFKKSVIGQVNERQLYDSMAYPLAQGLAYVFGNAKQGKLTVKLDQIHANPSRLGDMYALNINTLLSHFTFTFKVPTDYANGRNLVLTSMKTDYSSGITEATFFIRGD